MSYHITFGISAVGVRVTGTKRYLRLSGLFIPSILWLTTTSRFLRLGF